MPNVSPRGLHARHGSTWKTPTGVYARDAGVWKPALYVWAYTGGVWQVVWGAAINPAPTVTATWVQPTSARIDWTLPNPNTATEWIVRRSDGSEVGRVAGNVTTITDLTPRVVSSADAPTTVPVVYTVTGADGGSQSGSASSAPLNVRLDPATVTPSVSYPSAASNSVATLSVSWTPNATYGDPDFWQVYIHGTGYIGARLPGSSRSTTLVGVLSRGYQFNIRVLPMMLLADGSVVQAGNSSGALNLNVTPNIPQSPNLYASGISNLCFTFAGPGAGTATNYTIERYNASTGPWTAWATTTSGGPHCFATSASHYVRVRTNAPGGSSDWVQVGPVAPVNDVTGPGPATISSWVPEASYGRMVVRGTMPSAPDMASYAIYMEGGSGWVLQASGSASASQSFGPLALQFSAGQNPGVLVRTWDGLGNMGTDAVAYYGVLDASPILIHPSDGGTARGGAWRTDGIGAGGNVLMGTTTAGENAGFLFYGDGIYNAVIRAGRTVTAIEFDYWRQNDQGSAACIQPRLWVHGELAKPAGPPGFGDGGVERLTACVARNTGFGPTQVRVGLPSDFITYFRLGYRGLVFYRPAPSSNPDDPNSYYMKLGPVPSSDGVVVMGAVNVHHLG